MLTKQNKNGLDASWHIMHKKWLDSNSPATAHFRSLSWSLTALATYSTTNWPVKPEAPKTVISYLDILPTQVLLTGISILDWQLFKMLQGQCVKSTLEFETYTNYPTECYD